MAFVNAWRFAPAPWTPFADREVLDRVMLTDIRANQGRIFENPEFELKCVYDARNYFAVDLFQRIRMSDVEDKKFVVVLPSPENSVYRSVAENLNKFRVSCRNVEVFFFDESANKKGEVAPYESPYSRSGQWMKYFYEKVDPALRMPMEQIHFWTKDNVDTYSDLIAEAGGADVIYSEMSWTGIRNIDAESFASKTVEELLSKGSAHVTPMMEQLCLDSLRGMFGCSGDISNVPPCTVTIGPKDLKAAKLNLCFNFLTSANGANNLQKPCLQLAMYGPIDPRNPGSILRLFPGTCYVSATVSAPTNYGGDEDWLGEKIEAIRKAEGGA
ncbi:MAG: hypothetical protein IJL72_03665 [Lachnospiraceae bacterium]|nr:hypothetical protein [Lachnospiraceae bacterium]